MAIIYSYPLVTPTVKDLLIGTITYDENIIGSPKNKPTVSFSVGDLLSMIGTKAGFQDLQSVTSIGATTNIFTTFSGGVKISSVLQDGNNSPGLATQILQSNGTSISWVDDKRGTVTSIATTSPIEGGTITGIGTITHQAVLTDAGGTAGSYTNTNLTVDAQGHITSASDGTGGGVISVEAYNTTDTADRKYVGLHPVTPATGAVKVGLAVTQMTSIGSAVADEDLMIVTDDPAGIPYNKKITVANLKTHINTTYDYLTVGTDPTFVLNAGIGTGYTAGVNLPTTATDDVGGATPGTGMTVDTTVNGSGVITLVTINNPGDLYDVGDIVTITGTTATITLSGTGSNNVNPNLRLIDNAFAFDDVKLTGGTNITITRTSDTGLTIASTSSNDNWYVTGGSFDVSNGDLSITGNNAAVGATIDLDGRYMSSLTTTGTTGASTFNAATGILNVPNYTFTEVDTLATVTARGASTATASTFSGGLTSSGILTCSGTGADAYSYFTGNGGGATPPSSFTHGMTQVWNNSAGSREWETFWATGADIEGDPAVPADGYAANKASYISGYNRYAGASEATPVDTRMYKWYGNGELELQDMATLPGGSATPTISNPHWRMPTTGAPGTGYLLAKANGSINLEWVEGASSATGTPNSTTFLRGDNTWAGIPTGLAFKSTWSAAGTGGGTPDLTTLSPADGWLYIVNVAGNAEPNGGAGTQLSPWSVGDWCIYNGTEWTRVPATNSGVTLFSSNFTSSGASDPQYISGTTLVNDVGSVDIGRVNLNATGINDSTTYLRGDNVWDARISAVNSGGGLQGGGTSGSLTLSPRYTTDANIILSAPSGSFGIATTSSGATNQTQLTFSASNSLEIQAGMIAGQTALGNNIGTVDSVNTTTGVVTFTANLGVAIGSAETVYFSSVITGSSQLLINNGTGASISEYNSYKALSTIGLSLFDNDVPFLTSAVTSITGKEPISIHTANPYSATSPRIDLNYDETGTNTDDNVVTAADSAGTDTLADSDLFLAADISTATNKVKKFTMTGLKTYIQLNTLTGVTAGAGLDGGGSSGNITLDVEYDTDGNVILESFSGDFIAVTTVGGSTSQTQLQFSAANIAKIKTGMVAGTTALGDDIGIVATSTGTTVTFTANLGVTIGAGANVNFSSVVTASSQLMFNAGTGASISEFVSHKALSTIDLGLFNNDQGWNSSAGTLTGVIGAEPLYSVTTGGGSATIPQIKLRYDEDSAGNNDSIITAAPAFGAGTADPTDLIIISDQSTSLNETKKIALSQLGFGSSSGTVQQVDTGDGLTGGPFSVSGTVSVMYTGTNNVILDATASTNIESSSKMMVSYDNGGGTIAAVNQMSLSDIPLGLFNNNLGWVVIGTTSTTALAGDTTTISTAQAGEITANTNKVGITTAQAGEITANTLKVTDSGVPAILSDGTLNRTAALIRGDIGAGTVTGVTAVGATNGTGGITVTGTAAAPEIGIKYGTTTNIIMQAYSTGTAIASTDEIIRYVGSPVFEVQRNTLADLKTWINSGAAGGTVTEVTGKTTTVASDGGGITVATTTSTPVVGVYYGAPPAGTGIFNVISAAPTTTQAIVAADDQILIQDPISHVTRRTVSLLPFTNNTGTVTNVGATAPVMSSGGSNPTISMGAASGSANGYLTSINWTTFNNKTSNTGTVTGVTATAPIVSSGGTAPAISIAVATGSVNGYLSSTDWTTFNNKTSNTGTVTSVGGTGTVSGLTLSGTVTTTGNLTLGGTLSLTSANVTSGLGFTPYNATNPAGYTTNTGTVTQSSSTAGVIPKFSTVTNVTDSAMTDTGSGITLTSTSGNYGFTVTDGSGFKHTVSTSGQIGFLAQYTGGSTGTLFRGVNGASTTIFNVTNTGYVTCTTLTATGDVIAYSDERLKTNIKTLDGSKVYKMHGVSFNKDGKKSSGVIAQEMQKVAPELVNNEGEYLGVAYGNISGYLIEAIKELKMEIEELKARPCNCK